jgi:hypothetical protein
MDAVLDPKQLALIWLKVADIGVLGWNIDTEVLEVHPFISVTVTVYTPAVNPEAVELVPPEGLHR